MSDALVVREHAPTHCWQLRMIGALAIAAMCLGVGAVLALAQPVWVIVSAANTKASPGGTIEYHVTADNIGTTPTGQVNDGGTPDDPSDDVLEPSPFEIQVTLPEGLTANSAFPTYPTGTWDCSASSVPLVVGASSFTCADTTDMLDPGDVLTGGLTVVADVTADAPSTVTSGFMVSGGGATLPATTVDPTVVSGSAPGFGFDAVDGQVTANPAGDPYTQAGGHPYALLTQVDFNTVTDSVEGPIWPVEPVKNLSVEPPPGLVADPTVPEQCTMAELAPPLSAPATCPSGAQIGTVRLLFSSGLLKTVPLFNMVPPRDAPARFGFNVSGTVITLDGAVHVDPSYHVAVTSRNAPEALAIVGVAVRLWGVPADPAHDGERSCPGTLSVGCSTEAPRRAFLRNPTSCTALGVGLLTTVSMDSWVHPGEFVSDGFTSHLPPNYPAAPADRGTPQGPTGCDQVPFDASLSMTPATPRQAGAPSGASFDLVVPQRDDPSSVGESDLKKAVVEMPAGLRVSPSSADGLQACSPAQIGLHNEAKPSCPDGSKIGQLTLETPLLDEPLEGAVYLATPHDNPAGTLLAVYLVAEGPGLVVKLAGRVDANPTTGALTATFDNNPQLPFSHLHVQFKDGPRAPFSLPAKCGTYTTRAVLTSWSGATVETPSTFTVDHGAGGGACSAGPVFAPKFFAQMSNPVAGAHSTFLLSFSRSDADEEFGSLALTMPQGLLARIKGVPQCGSADAGSGTCGSASRIGSVLAGAGAGNNPFFLPGTVYFGGPYKGAPFSLVIVVPAVAGPFDLGKVVIRAAIKVDRKTAVLRVVPDPLPTILQGIPLQVRKVQVAIDRSRFMLNPTSCHERRIAGTLESTEGTKAAVASRFQVGECDRLRLRPRMTLSVGGKGHTRAGTFTPLVAKLTQTSGQANLKSVSVTLPLSLNARLPVVTNACTQEEFDTGHCEKAKTGTAVAVTPLLDKPLRGGAYFVKRPGGGLPNLVVALRGQVDFDLVGAIKIPGGERLLTRFNTVPDVPISSFTLRLSSTEEHGAVGVAEDLCTRKAGRMKAQIAFRGQEGSSVHRTQRLHIAGCNRGKSRDRP